MIGDEDFLGLDCVGEQCIVCELEVAFTRGTVLARLLPFLRQISLALHSTLYTTLSFCLKGILGSWFLLPLLFIQCNSQLMLLASNFYNYFLEKGKSFKQNR